MDGGSLGNFLGELTHVSKMGGANPFGQVGHGRDSWDGHKSIATLILLV